jgi:His/Glu/Gln/Arg/opine family amino acid ABC transporter permease subunit
VNFDTGVILRNLPALWSGFETTFVLVVISMVLGTVLGLLACFGKLLGRGLLFWLSSAYITTLRGIPEIVVMFWIYYCGPLILDTRLGSFNAGLASMTLYAGANLAEIFRAGILAVPRGQSEAANALGLPAATTWISVVLPQALRIMVPALLGLVTLVVKISGIASAIGVAELVYQANILAGQSYRYFELFTVVGAAYFVLIFPLSLTAQYYERRLARRTR